MLSVFDLTLLSRAYYRDARRGNLGTRSSPITSLQRMDKRHYSLQSGSSGVVSFASRGSLSRKKATHPASSRKMSDSSSIGSANPKIHPYCSFRKDRDLPKAYHYRNDERIRHSSKDSVVEVLCPLKSDTDATSPETTKDLIGEYRKRLYKRGDAAANIERLKESQSGVSKRQVISHLQKDVGQKTTKLTSGVRKPAHYLQFPCEHSCDQNQGNDGPVLEKLMTDIVKRIQSYESSYYSGFWCDKNNYYRSRPRTDMQAQTPPVSHHFYHIAIISSLCFEILVCN